MLRKVQVVTSAVQYASELDASGVRTLPGSGESFWVRYERQAMVRMPTFHLEPPAPGEVRRVLWNARAMVASYIVEPDSDHPPNAWLYICCDRDYCLEKLSKPARRDARRALRSLHIASVDSDMLLRHGFAAYQETCTRVGLVSDTLEQFRRGFESFSRNPAHRFVGAWKENTLVAFMMLIVVNDWVEIQGSFSCHAYRHMCPNDGLTHYLLKHFLVDGGFKIVSYGLSSVQETADVTGLHAFKKKVGFEARPVHRAFVVHPFLRPFSNRFVLWGTQTALRFYPNARLLRKASGVLARAVTPNDQRQLFN